LHIILYDSLYRNMCIDFLCVLSQNNPNGVFTTALNYVKLGANVCAKMYYVCATEGIAMRIIVNLKDRDRSQLIQWVLRSDDLSAIGTLPLHKQI